MSEEFIQKRLAALSENGIDTISSLRADKAALTARVVELEGALVEIAYCEPNKEHNGNTNDLVACRAVNLARAALTQPTKGGE